VIKQLASKSFTDFIIYDRIIIIVDSYEGGIENEVY